MRIAMLSGGVGGARLARGLAAELGPDLSVVVNVGDDEDIYGLHVSPDIDTVVYTMAGVEGPHGWGRAKESWTAMEELVRFPTDSEFRIGDRDLATNLFRTAGLHAGAPLSAITSDIAAAFQLSSRVLPASDDPVRTFVQTAVGGEWLDFQTYFVRRRHRDPLRAIRYDGADAARAAPGVVEAIAAADAVILGPSNPPLSIHPILAVPEIGTAVAEASRVVAVSPLIGGDAVKGPAADILVALGHPRGNRGVVSAYGGILTHIVVDTADSDDADELGIDVLVTDIRIPDLEASRRLSREVLAWQA